MYDKLVYSLIWLLVLLYGLGYINHHPLMWWHAGAYWVLIGAILIQLPVIIYHGSDAYTRHRMWQKMRGKP